MDNNYNSNDYYQNSDSAASSGSGNKYSLNKSSDDVVVNGEASTSQSSYGQSPYGQNPYGGGQSPYGQNPYGGGQSPYGGSPYGSTYVNDASQFSGASSVPVTSAEINDILVKSFLIMFIALLVTGITALMAYRADFLFGDPRTAIVKIIVCFIAELALVFSAQAAMKKNNATLAGVLFAGYSIVNGLTLSVIFITYNIGDISRAFIITSFVFALMAGIGYFTKIDLTKLGNLLMIALIGIILGSLANMFIGSEPLDYVLTIAGIIIFMGLTAYDIQKIKKLASGYSYLSPMVIGLYGALELYLDFINLFLRILRIMGRSRR